MRGIELEPFQIKSIGTKKKRRGAPKGNQNARKALRDKLERYLVAGTDKGVLRILEEAYKGIALTKLTRRSLTNWTFVIRAQGILRLWTKFPGLYEFFCMGPARRQTTLQH